MPIWLQIVIIFGAFTGMVIPVLALWIKLKENQSHIGTMTSELEQTVAAQQKTLDAAQQRIQNLEAIVTSQVWDIAHDEGLSGEEKQKALSQARLHLDAPDVEESDRERAERLARRLQT